MGRINSLIFFASLSIGRLNCCWSSPAQSILVSSTVWIHDSFFFLRHLAIWKWGLLFDERRGLNTTGLPLLGVTTTGTHSLTGFFLNTQTTDTLHSQFCPTFVSLHIEYFIRHGPHRKLRVQQVFCCCMCIRCRGKESTEPRPRNSRLLLLHNSSFQALEGHVGTRRSWQQGELINLFTGAREAEESTLLEAAARERLLKTQQAGKSLTCAVVICGD
jgi:hypothetical protein